MKKTSTKTLSFIGSGNVATHLALAFHAAGYTIGQVLSRQYEHAALLASRVGASAANDPGRLRDDADVYILAVNDNALYDLVLDLHLPPSALVVHTSGSTPAHILQRLSLHYGVLWSPQTFVRDIAMDYSRLPLCIEASSPADEEVLEALAKSITDNVYRLDFEQRRRAHLAAVFVSNFVGAMNAVAQDIMQAEGLDFSMLRPLAEQTLRKMDYGPLWYQVTGPAARRDTKTIAAQRRLLADDPQLLQLYDTLTEFIQQKT